MQLIAQIHLLIKLIMKKISTLNMSRAGFKSRGFTHFLYALSFIALAVVSGCKKDTYKATEGLCPVVVSTDPTDKAVDVALNKIISVTFNTAMDSLTINASSFTIKQGANVISGKVATTPDNKVFTFKPDVALSPFLVYTGTITAKATDVFHTAMVADYVWTFTTIPLVTITAAPVLGGVVTGAGTFAQGSVATVTATPNTGFTFVNWTVNGTTVSTSSSYQFTIAGNRALVANFAAIPAGNFAVVLSSAPVAGGTTTGSGAYASGSTVTVTATPTTGYTFRNWTENGTIVSTSSSYQFTLTGNRTLVANYTVIPASQLALVLSSNPVIGGSTSGSGSYSSGTSVTAVASPNSGYSFTNWTESGNPVSTSASYTFAITTNRTLVANFAPITYTLTTNAVNGTVAKNPNAATYNSGAVVQLTATPNPGYTFTGWSGDATGNTNPLNVTMNANKNITALFTLVPAIGPGQVNLGLAGNYNMLTKTGITTTGVTSIQGDLGVSPAAATSITGFGLIMDSSGEFSKTPIVTGRVYAADYAAPTPSNLTTAVSNMETAYTTANNLVTPAPIVDLYAGDISGRILPPGLYKYNTGVLITNAGVTLSGGANDTWVIQIAQNLTINNSAIITLLGGAQAKNIVWVVAGQATLGTNVDFSGILLSKTLISLQPGAKVTGRLLAQTAVTLNNNIVVLP
jgi:uncharacterized repeat protein (TIGR02543 family)